MTELELQEMLEKIKVKHPEWWNDPHYQLHRQYGWTPRKK